MGQLLNRRSLGDGVPEAMNVHLSFEEALKLYFGLGQLLARLNSYNRATKEGRRAAANLCLYPHKGRITVNEGRLRPPGKSKAVTPPPPPQDAPAPPQGGGALDDQP